MERLQKQEERRAPNVHPLIIEAERWSAARYGCTHEERPAVLSLHRPIPYEDEAYCRVLLSQSHDLPALHRLIVEPSHTQAKRFHVPPYQVPPRPVWGPFLLHIKSPIHGHQADQGERVTTASFRLRGVRCRWLSGTRAAWEAGPDDHTTRDGQDTTSHVSKASSHRVRQKRRPVTLHYYILQDTV